MLCPARDSRENPFGRKSLVVMSETAEISVQGSGRCEVLEQDRKAMRPVGEDVDAYWSWNGAVGWRMQSEE